MKAESDLLTVAVAAEPVRFNVPEAASSARVTDIVAADPIKLSVPDSAVSV
jgi:hypothetical protein